ncbi:MAG: EAL domain-containing protein [Myxococcales bacterium]|nr:EAL domain-containing protein [Myxococcales bacterium]
MRWTVDLDSAALRLPSDRPPPVRALGAEDIGVVFQPIVDLQTGRCFAHEALVRCKIEAYRNPTELFEYAVEQGAVGRLGRTIREVTIARANGADVFINIHPEELSSRWLIRPDDALSLHDGDLYLEITETAALDYFDLCASVLKEICARTGAHLVVDDFGAGYSNLKRVIDLEPSIVKLDRALISGIDKHRRQQILVEQLVNTCAALDARVVAEGIETVAELRAVQDAGVQLGQGYLLARPADPPPPIYWPD